jgi:hypothetical protein
MLTAKPMTSDHLDTLGCVQPDPLPVATGGWFQERRRVIAVVVGLAILVGLVAVGYQRAYGRLVHGYDSGPVYTGSGTKTSFPVDLGQPFTYGVITVSNRTSRTAVLTDVRVKPSLPPGMEIIEVKVVGPNRKTAVFGTHRQYPPLELAPHLRPLKGARVPPKDTPEGDGGVEIVFGLKVTRPGMFGFRQVELDYRIGKKPYTVRLEDGFVGCAPYAEYQDRCSIEKFFGSRS